MFHPHPDIDNLDHDPELAAALENMIVAWARAETALVNVFALVSGMHFNVATVAYYRIPTFEARCKVIQALLEVWPLQPTHRRDALAKEVQKLRKLTTARRQPSGRCGGSETAPPRRPRDTPSRPFELPARATSACG
jgi:hypothetical protein